MKYSEKVMASLAMIREGYPQLGHVTDDELVDRLHRKFYAHLTREAFDARLLGDHAAPALAEFAAALELAVAMEFSAAMQFAADDASAARMRAERRASDAALTLAHWKAFADARDEMIAAAAARDAENDAEGGADEGDTSDALDSLASTAAGSASLH